MRGYAKLLISAVARKFAVEVRQLSHQRVSVHVDLRDDLPTSANANVRAEKDACSRKFT